MHGVILQLIGAVALVGWFGATAMADGLLRRRPSTMAPARRRARK